MSNIHAREWIHCDYTGKRGDVMKKAENQNLLFDLTHPFEATVMQDLHDYFDWMYFAN